MTLRVAFLLALSTAIAAGYSEENVTQDLDAASGGNLIVDVAFGTIDVSSGPNDKVSVQAQRKIETSDEQKEKQYLTEVPIVISKEGNTITVHARRGDNASWSWNCNGNTSMDAHYTIRVPKTFNLDLKTGGGTISADDVAGQIKVATGGGKLTLSKLRGPVGAKTSGGSIRLADCEGTLEVKTSGGAIKATAGGGSLDARTSGGSIVVRDFNGDTSVKTSGGQLTFQNVRGKMSGKTSGGSISAVLVSPLPGDVELLSSAGSITLTVPSDAALTLEAEADMGTVSSDLPIVATTSERDELKGALNGGGKSVILRSSVGSISIRSATPPTVMQ